MFVCVCEVPCVCVCVCVWGGVPCVCVCAGGGVRAAVWVLGGGTLRVHSRAAELLVVDIPDAHRVANTDGGRLGRERVVRDWLVLYRERLQRRPPGRVRQVVCGDHCALFLRHLCVHVRGALEGGRGEVVGMCV